MGFGSHSDQIDRTIKIIFPIIYILSTKTILHPLQFVTPSFAEQNLEKFIHLMILCNTETV